MLPQPVVDRCGVLQGDKIQWIDTTGSILFCMSSSRINLLYSIGCKTRNGYGGVDNILNEIVTQFEIPNIPLPCLVSGFPADGLNN